MTRSMPLNWGTCNRAAAGDASVTWGAVNGQDVAEGDRAIQRSIVTALINATHPQLRAAREEILAGCR